MNECCSCVCGVGCTSSQSGAMTLTAARIAAAKGRRLYRLMIAGSVLAAVAVLLLQRTILHMESTYVRCDAGNYWESE